MSGQFGKRLQKLCKTADSPDGPRTWKELVRVGGEIKRRQGVSYVATSVAQGEHDYAPVACGSIV